MSFFSCTCAASESRCFVLKSYAEDVKVNEILRVDVEQTHSEDTHREILISHAFIFLFIFGVSFN